MFNKKSLFWAVFLIFLLILSACGGEETEESNNSDSDDVINLTIAHNDLTESLYQESILVMAELLEDGSDGRIEVETYPEGQLGFQPSIVEQTQMGSIDITLQLPATIGNFVEEAEVASLPFIWPSEEVFYEIMGSDAVDPLKEALEEKNLMLLGAFGDGFKVMTSNKEPILSPTDLEGLDFRVAAGPLPQKIYNNWGANPEPVDYSELYNALQLGIVDAQDNSITGISYAKLDEVQDHLAKTNHEFSTSLMLMNTESFNSLPSDLQDLVIESYKEAEKYEREAVNELLKEHEEILSEGMEIHELSDSQTEEFRNETAPVYEEFSSTDRKKKLLNNIQDATK